MENTKPCDYLPLKAWFVEYGTPVFGSDKMLHYHTKPIQRELIEAGAMAKVGVNIFLHKTRFWPEYQRIVSANCGKQMAAGSNLEATRNDNWPQHP